MKLPTAPPSYASLTTLTNWVKSLAASVAAGWNKDHKPDGTHKDIHADTVTTAGDLAVGEDVSIAGTLDVTGQVVMGRVRITPTGDVLIGGALAGTLQVVGAFSGLGDLTVDGVGVTVRAPAFFTSTVDALNGYSERGRATPLGEWTAVTYNSGNFSGAGGGTWTVASGDVSSNRYTLVGKTLFWNCWLSSTSISGTVTQLNLTIPGGFSAAATTKLSADLYDNGTFADSNVRVAASGTTVAVNRADGSNFAASTDNTQVRLFAIFEIA